MCCPCFVISVKNAALWHHLVFIVALCLQKIIAVFVFCGPMLTFIIVQIADCVEKDRKKVYITANNARLVIYEKKMEGQNSIIVDRPQHRQFRRQFVAFAWRIYLRRQKIGSVSTVVI